MHHAHALHESPTPKTCLYCTHGYIRPEITHAHSPRIITTQYVHYPMHCPVLTFDETPLRAKQWVWGKASSMKLTPPDRYSIVHMVTTGQELHIWISLDMLLAVLVFAVTECHAEILYSSVLVSVIYSLGVRDLNALVGWVNSPTSWSYEMLWKSNGQHQKCFDIEVTFLCSWKAVMAFIQQWQYDKYSQTGKSEMNPWDVLPLQIKVLSNVTLTLWIQWAVEKKMVMVSLWLFFLAVS